MRGRRRARRLAGRIWRALRKRWRGLGTRWRWRLALAALAGLIVLPPLACADRPPRQPEDLCAIFEEKRSWYKAARRSFERWGVPEAVQLAVIYRESGFRARARPPRRKILWILPGPRPSSAFGYGQVVDATWESYRRAAGDAFAERDDFADVADFVGWYGAEIHRLTGVAKDDAQQLYLAYHEGPEGFRRGRHHGRDWLLTAARQVARRAQRYQRQLDSCREDLDRWWQWW